MKMAVTKVKDQGSLVQSPPVALGTDVTASGPCCTKSPLLVTVVSLPYLEHYLFTMAKYIQSSL